MRGSVTGFLSVLSEVKGNILNESNNLISIYVWVLFSKRSNNVLPGILWESGFWSYTLLVPKLFSLDVST